MSAVLWPEPWLRRHGGFPTHYVALDIETTGFARDDVIVGISHRQVEAGELTCELYCLLDWRDTPSVKPLWLRGRLGDLCRELDGYNLTYERLCDEGLPAREVLGHYHQILTTLRDADYALVTFNGLRFDESRLANHFRWHDLDAGFTLGERAIDLLAWAVLLRGPDPAVAAWRPDDTLRSWSKRLLGQVSRFRGLRLMEDLALEYNWALDQNRLHEADLGAVAAHRLMEEIALRCQHRGDPWHPSQWEGTAQPPPSPLPPEAAPAGTPAPRRVLPSHPRSYRRQRCS